MDDAERQESATPPMTGWMLGIDTSAEIVSVALARLDGYGSEAELTWPAGRNQTTTLLAQIDHLLNLCSIESDAITAVAVTTGPGGFNALRVGMSVAKGFAFAYGLPIVGVGTLDVVAYPFSRCGLPVRAFVTAGRGRVVFADYRTVGGAFRLDSEMTHRAPADLAADLLTPTVLAGELAVADAERLREESNVVLPGAGLRGRSASHLIDLARQRLETGDGSGDDLTELEPLYVHQHSDAAQARGTAPATTGHPSTGTGTHA